MESKTCSKCKKELPLTEFYLTKTYTGRIVRRSQCRKCGAKDPEKMKIYRENNIEKIRQVKKIWQQKNKKKLAAYEKEWREKNIDRIKHHEKEYRETHKEEIKKRKKLDYENNKEKRKEHYRIYHKKHYQENRDSLLLKGKQYREAHQEHRSAWAKEYAIKKKKSIYGPDWQQHHFLGEFLTENILNKMFPNIKIRRGAAGKISTDGECIRKRYVYPDFRFIYLDKEIIIEYNGNQHYKHIRHMMPLNGFLEIQKRDNWLRKYCKQERIIFIEIDAREVYTNKNKIETKIKEELHRHGICEPIIPSLSP